MLQMIIVSLKLLFLLELLAFLTRDIYHVFSCTFDVWLQVLLSTTNKILSFSVIKNEEFLNDNIALIVLEKVPSKYFPTFFNCFCNYMEVMDVYGQNSEALIIK